MILLFAPVIIGMGVKGRHVGTHAFLILKLVIVLVLSSADEILLESKVFTFDWGDRYLLLLKIFGPYRGGGLKVIDFWRSVFEWRLEAALSAIPHEVEILIASVVILGLVDVIGLNFHFSFIWKGNVILFVMIFINFSNQDNTFI